MKSVKRKQKHVSFQIIQDIKFGSVRNANQKRLRQLSISRTLEVKLMKKLINVLQLCGAMGFAYFGGILGSLIFPLTYNSQIIGIGVFCIISFLIFIYATFNVQEASNHGGKNNG